MHSLAASLLVLLALALAAAGMVYWHPDGFVAIVFAAVILGLALLLERRARAGGE